MNESYSQLQNLETIIQAKYLYDILPIQTKSESIEETEAINLLFLWLIAQRTEKSHKVTYK